MEIIILLKEVLRPHLGWHGARLAFAATFLIALFRVKTINLSELAVGFVGQAKSESHYKRLQRFFREFEVDYSEIAKTVVRLMKIPEPWVLSCDRTEWQYGKTTFNTEAMYFLLELRGWSGQHILWQFLDRKALHLHNANEAGCQRIRALMGKYQNIPMDLADASLVAAAESQNIRRIFTLDSDFYVYRINDKDAFEVFP